MVLKYAIDTASVTPVLTSCGRFDLLEQTVQSFFEHFETDRLIVSDDSLRFGEAAAFANAYPQIEMRSCWERLGRLRAIDALYGTLRTPYVFHLEDDWCFTGDANLDDVCDYLDARPDVSVVCVGWRPDARYAGKAKTDTFRGHDYRVWDLDAHPRRFSYTFNPAVARTALWRQIGPFAKFHHEEGLSAFCKARGMRIAMLERPIAYHLGDRLHAYDRFEAHHASTLLSRLRRSAARRWPMATGERLQWP
jgi:hypothetical protein